MGGTELVYELFSECHKKDSFDGLCVDNPDLVWGLVSSLGFALLIKALLTVSCVDAFSAYIFTHT